MTVLNQTRGLTVASRALRAGTFWSRFQGLMGKRSFEVGEALIIEPCSGVHTYFMRFAIDVFHVAADGRILRIIPNMRPWRLGPMVRGSRFVVELPAGAALASGTREGDVIICD